MRTPCCLCVCLGRLEKSLLVLASTIILGSDSRRTHDHILLSLDSGSRATLPVYFFRLCIPPYFFVFYAVRIVSKEIRRLVFPRTSCYAFLELSYAYYILAPLFNYPKNNISPGI
jgi:hypothetical protein